MAAGLEKVEELDELEELQAADVHRMGSIGFAVKKSQEMGHYLDREVGSEITGVFFNMCVH